MTVQYHLNGILQTFAFSKKILYLCPALRNRWWEKVWPANVAFGFKITIKANQAWI
jgi:hypothetical protein